MGDTAATGPIDWGAPGAVRYTIGEVVGRTGVPASSIHHYRRLGLIPEPQRNAANQFSYDDRHVAALAAVRSLRGRGYALEEIGTLLRERGTDGCVDASGDVGDRSPEGRLIDAAIDAFAEQSFTEVSIAALCERAGIAKATFYRYYDSKEMVFLATATAIIERAASGFAGEIDSIDQTEHATAFAGHLRRGLPVLFELAKRLALESGPAISDAAAMFAGLARRLGHIVDAGSPDEQAEQAGGLLIMLALVRIFEELLEADLTKP